MPEGRAAVDGVTSAAPSGVAGAFPHLVSRLARACDDHETDAPRSVLAEVTSGPPMHEFLPPVERERAWEYLCGGNTPARPGTPHR